MSDCEFFYPTPYEQYSKKGTAKSRSVPLTIDEGVLMCPTCEEGYLHQVEVRVWFREEDAEQGQHASVNADRAVTTQDMQGNPSPRRSGLKIMLECEQCHLEGDRPKHELLVYQHVGQTCLELLVHDE